MQSGTLSVTFGAQTGTSSSKRSPKFVSPNAATALVSINSGTATSFDVSATSPLCQTVSTLRTCAIPLTLPVGQDSVSVTLKSAAPSSLTLGSGSNSVTVIAGNVFTLAVGVNPAVAGGNAITFSPSPSFVYDTASTITATVLFDDPSGATITGSGNVPNFLVPLTLTSSDPHITLSPTTLTTPGQTFTAHYDGSAAVSSRLTVTAMAGTTMIASGSVIAPGLNVTRYNLGPIGSGGVASPAQITVGPDGKIWWAESATHSLGRIDPAVGLSSLTHFPTGLPSGPFGIVGNAADNTIWYSGGTTIGRITTSGGAPITGLASINAGSGSVQQLAVDSQGNVFYTNPPNNQVGYVDVNTDIVHTNGAVATTGAISSISGLTLGTDNNMYYTEPPVGKIGRSTTPVNGTPLLFTDTVVPGSTVSIFPWDIAAGPDGNIWFGEFANNGANQFFGKFTPGVTFTITEFANTFDPNAFANLVTMAKGPDGNMWIAEGGGAVSINPASPTLPNVQFFSDNGQTTMVKCVGGKAPDVNMWCSAIGGPSLSPGFIPTADAILSWTPR